MGQPSAVESISVCTALALWYLWTVLSSVANACFHDHILDTIQISTLYVVLQIVLISLCFIFAYFAENKN